MSRWFSKRIATWIVILGSGCSRHVPGSLTIEVEGSYHSDFEHASTVGPRQQIPDDAPASGGFDVFAIPVPGTLSRSGQPSIDQFAWLRDNGWQGIVDLRTDGEYSE